jgi:hypothetical protein
MNDAVSRETSVGQREMTQRALALWPRLNASLVRRCGGDPWRIARLVSRRTSLPAETIVGMLRTTRVTITRISVVEGETWFG